MPCLKHIVQNAVTDEYKLLRGKTIECISLIGLAVGREKVRVIILQNDLTDVKCYAFHYLSLVLG